MSEESQYSEHPGGWIEWFCALPQNSFLCEVDEDFIQNPKNFESFFHLYPAFSSALSMILSPEQPDSLDLENEKFLEIYSEACDIYGLFHALYITTPKGLAIMRERFLIGKFGHCPRVMCEKQNVLPIGLSESLKTSRIKVYCPRCKEAYAPRRSQADFDGAYVGRSFPQLLLMTYPDIHPKNTIQLGTPLYTPFESTLFGFKIHDPERITQKEEVPAKIQQEVQQQVVLQENQNQGNKSQSLAQSDSLKPETNTTKASTVMEQAPTKGNQSKKKNKKQKHN